MSIISKTKSLAAQIGWSVFPDFMVRRIVKKVESGEKISSYHCADLYSNIQENFNFFLNDEQLKDDLLIKKLTFEIVRCHYKFGVDINEFFCYDFAHKSDRERSKYLSRHEKDVICSKAYGDRSVQMLSCFIHKYNFYNLAKEYFKRDAILISNINDVDVLNDFIQKHLIAFAKPESGRGGKGAFLIKADELKNQGVEVFLQELLADGSKWIFEELVRQDKRMSYWNESSINTVRISSIMTSHGIVCFYPFMRFGKTGSIVDNASSGGYFVAIDEKTGTVTTDAFDKRGHHHERHPEHGDVIKGHVIPEWNELIKKAKELHKNIFPTHKYIGFDFALTPQGWVVIEANWGHFAPLQVAIERGIKEEFINIMKS